jgi:hypothetical protein
MKQPGHILCGPATMQGRDACAPRCPQGSFCTRRNFYTGWSFYTQERPHTEAFQHKWRPHKPVRPQPEGLPTRTCGETGSSWESKSKLTLFWTYFFECKFHCFRQPFRSFRKMNRIWLAHLSQVVEPLTSGQPLPLRLFVGLQQVVGIFAPTSPGLCR